MITSVAAARIALGPEGAPLSPLRYPGGKQSLVPYAAAWLKINDLYGANWIEPFAGGASMAISLLHCGAVKSVQLVEKDPLVYAFWKCAISCPGRLCERLWKLDVSIDTWMEYRRFLVDDALRKFPLIDCAVAGLFLNRVNYSGIISANPIGGIDQTSEYAIGCRFTKDTIVERICDVANLADQIHVAHGDGIGFLRRKSAKISQDKSAVYVDPPYFYQGKKLYRHSFTESQHEKLASVLLEAPFQWLVSYDNAPFISNLYRGCRKRMISWRYTVRQQKDECELLISNSNLLPTTIQARRIVAGTIFE